MRSFKQQSTSSRTNNQSILNKIIKMLFRNKLFYNKKKYPERIDIDPTKIRSMIDGGFIGGDNI